MSRSEAISLAGRGGRAGSPSRLGCSNETDAWGEGTILGGQLGGLCIARPYPTAAAQRELRPTGDVSLADYR